MTALATRDHAVEVRRYMVYSPSPAPALAGGSVVVSRAMAKPPSGSPSDTATSVVGTDVQTFCARFGLFDYLDIALAIARSRFDLVGSAKVSVEYDPEEGDEWLEVAVTVRGEVKQTLAAFDRYTEDWLSSAPRHLWRKVRLQPGAA